MATLTVVAGLSILSATAASADSPYDPERQKELAALLLLRDLNKVEDAARQRDLAKVESLVTANPATVTAKDKDGVTVLHIAAVLGDIPTMTYLLDHKADVNAHDNDGNTPLISISCLTVEGQMAVVAASGQTEAARFLLAHGGDIDAKNKRGATALWYAAYCGDMAMAQTLVAAGAKVNLADTKEHTPLYAATARWARIRSSDDRLANPFQPQDDIAAMLRAHGALGPSAQRKCSPPGEQGQMCEVDEGL